MATTESHRTNFAARMGRWSAQHRRKAILGWLAFVVAAVVVGNVAGMNMLSTSDSLAGESATAQRILDRAGVEHPTSETIIVSSPSRTIADPWFRWAIKDAVAAVRAQPHTANVRSPLAGDGTMLIAKDRHAALVQFDVEGDHMQVLDRVKPVLGAVAGVQEAHPNVHVGEFGAASFAKAAEDSSGQDF